VATLRKKYMVSWDDREPVEVATSARDMVNVPTEYQDNPATATFALLHASLIRHGHDVPPFEDFLDVLDDVSEVGTVVADLDDPTHAGPSAGELLPSPA
jgi:hypothetical protein